MHIELLPTDLTNRFVRDALCYSNSFSGAMSSNLFLNETIQLNCVRSKCATSATVDITGKFESLFGFVVKL